MKVAGAFVLVILLLMPQAHIAEPQRVAPPSPVVQSSSTSVFWVGAQTLDSSVTPNLGVMASIQVISTTTEGSGCLSFWVSDSEFTNGLWAQVGYYECSNGPPTAFFQIWNIPTDTELGGGTTSISSGVTDSFSMVATSSTSWSFYVNSALIGSYAIGTTSLSPTYPIYSLGELQGSSPFSYPSVLFSKAIDALVNGAWTPSETATAYNTDGLGVEGSHQNSALPDNSILLGGSTTSQPSGTTLWNSRTTLTAQGTVSVTTTTITST